MQAILSEEENWLGFNDAKEWKPGLSCSYPKQAKHGKRGGMTGGNKQKGSNVEVGNNCPLFTQAGEYRLRPVLEALSVNNQHGKMLSITNEIKVAARIPPARSARENPLNE
jgi:hypothetical protein